MDGLVLALLIAITSHAHELPVNPTLGVPGFPDCVRVRPHLNMTIDEAAADLRCSQREAPATTLRVGCVGDSITAGVLSSGGDHPYPQQLQLLLDSAHGPGKFSVTNLGACGSTMQKQGDSPFWKRPQFDALTQGKWDVVTIMLGTNDAKDAGSMGPGNWQHDCGSPVDPVLSNCSFASDYHAMIEVVKTLGAQPGVPPQIFLVVPPPLMQRDAYGMNQTVINAIFPYLIPKIAAAHPAVTGVIDLFTPMGGEYEWTSDTLWPKGCAVDAAGGITWPACGWFCDTKSNRCDQCHPSDAGYAHLANVLKSGLRL